MTYGGGGDTVNPSQEVLFSYTFLNMNMSNHTLIDTEKANKGSVYTEYFLCL